MKNLLYISFLLVAVLYSCSSQKTIETDNSPKIIKGVVISGEDGLPMPIVPIVVKFSEKERNTTTDFDGNFEIEVKKGEILIISYFGYGIEEVIITEQNSYDITLKLETSRVRTKKEKRHIKRELRKKGYYEFPD